jgi:hypothetical protein
MKKTGSLDKVYQIKPVARGPTNWKETTSCFPPFLFRRLHMVHMNKPDPRNIKMIAMLSHYHAPMQNSIRNPTKHLQNKLITRVSSLHQLPFFHGIVGL